MMNFLAPVALWFAALLPVVVVFYLLKRRRTVRLVSSTVLWQRFLADMQASAPFQRLRRNWLLYLQLLLLALAILALARPYWSGHVSGGRLQVVVLDASASMQSRDVEPSRFEHARAEALRLVDALRDTDQMVVLQAAAVAEVRQSATSEKAALRRAIESCRVTDGRTELTEALRMAESLTRDNNEAEVHLFSDGAAPGLEEFENKGLPLVYHRVGDRANNRGIVALEVRPNPENPAQRAVFAAVANAGPQPAETGLELRFDGQLVDTRQVRIGPTNSEPVVFVAEQMRDGVFTARLTEPDDLDVDNEAFVPSHLPPRVKVLLVSRGNLYLEKAIRAAGPIDLATSTSLAGPAREFDVVVLDGVAPSGWPEANVLAVQVADPEWLAPSGTVEGPPVVDWKASHPLMRFVGLDNVLVAKALRAPVPGWAVAVVESPQTPLILAGEPGRHRVVWCGFDFLESTWPLRVSFPIFVANALDWLNPASIEEGRRRVRAGDPVRWPVDEGTDSISVVGPDGESIRVVVDEGARDVVFGDTAQKGIYRFGTGTNESLVAVNLLDPSETDIRPRTELDFGRFGTVTESTERRASLEVWRWFALAALAVLFLEWWYYHRRTA